MSSTTNTDTNTSPVVGKTAQQVGGRTKCALSKRRLVQHAPATVEANYAGVPVLLGFKRYSTGSLGWYGNAKVAAVIDGVPVTVQVGITATVVGSKEASE